MRCCQRPQTRAQCWATKPAHRPAFAVLEAELADIAARLAGSPHDMDLMCSAKTGLLAASPSPTGNEYANGFSRQASVLAHHVAKHVAEAATPAVVRAIADPQQQGGDARVEVAPVRTEAEHRPRFSTGRLPGTDVGGSRHAVSFVSTAAMEYADSASKLTMDARKEAELEHWQSSDV